MSRRSLRSGTPSLRLREARAAEAAEETQSQRGRKRTRTPSPRRSASPSVPATAARLLLTLRKQGATPNTGGDTATSRPPTTEGAKDTPSFGRATQAQRLELLQSAFRPRSPQVISEEEEGSLGGSPTQSEEEEVVESAAIPPSAQTDHSNTSKRQECRGRLLVITMPKKKTVDDPPFGGDLTITASRMKRPYALTINTQADFEIACRRWWDILHEPRRAEWEMAAQLILTYEERTLPTSPPSRHQSLSDSDGASSTRSRHKDSTQGRRRKDKERRTSKSKKSKTAAPSATQRQREQRQQRAEIEDQVGKQQLLLSQRYKCLRQHCKNNPRMCYDQPGGGGHLALSMPLLKMWADAIAHGTATPDEPSHVVMDALVAAKNRKERTQQSPHPSLSNLGQNSPNLMPYITYNINPPHSGIQQPLSGTTAFSAAAPPIEPRSSPPQREGDDDNNMRAYFDWLSTQFPIHGPRFLEIKDVVTENGWGFSDLKGCTDTQWNGMDVAPGFVAKIRRNLKIFAHLPTVQSRLSDDAGSPTGSLSA
ncbi:hypothetical protein LTR10_015042 [Elasticomyces elasticus]|uniref:Uncharacterized protein n=1 Tax=Exophiala sideris TaxID=1016849 RepID=A0ABR0JRI0_9EURO|nr:hypothetical protein LTR10_015042 [Elasticomyces elasticus]KAK5039918.1 hypothetical protein LTS07_000413 [Exophiala sideris]KAK5068297.1 hypothetical protein LTR69_000415 [Exophiala sideris]KAK5187598.1 hypothetical protein LTR44_000414 [Eurotiomycetes sp. CCFEE 6388]